MGKKLDDVEMKMAAVKSVPYKSFYVVQGVRKNPTGKRSCTYSIKYGKGPGDKGAETIYSATSGTGRPLWMEVVVNKFNTKDIAKESSESPVTE